MTQQFRRRIPVFAAVSAAALLLAASVPALAQPARDTTSVGPATVGDPWVKNGWKNGPIDVPAAFGEMASMSLPAGKYAVFAKVYGSSSNLGLPFLCRLQIGSTWPYQDQWDYSQESVPPSTTQVVALQVAGELAAPGRVVLLCRDLYSNGGLQAEWIKITAIRVGQLEWQNLGATVPSHAGSVNDPTGVRPATLGDPWVKYGWLDGPVDLPGQYPPLEITSMSLPAGPYVVFAKLYITGGDTDTSIECDLDIPYDVGPLNWDRSEETVPASTAQTIALSFAGQLTAPGKVALKCIDWYGGAQAVWIKIFAIRAGALDWRNVAGASVASSTDQPSAVDTATLADPWVRYGQHDNWVDIPADLATVAKMRLPAGQYVVFAKTYFWALNTQDEVQCRLKLGNDWDYAAEFVGWNTKQTIALNVTGKLPSRGNVLLACQDWQANGGPMAGYIGIAAIRVGTLKIVQLL